MLPDPLKSKCQVSIFLDHFAADIIVGSLCVAFDIHLHLWLQPVFVFPNSILVCPGDSPGQPLLIFTFHILLVCIWAQSTFYSTFCNQNRSFLCYQETAPEEQLAFLVSLRAALHGILSIRSLTKRKSAFLKFNFYNLPSFRIWNLQLTVTANKAVIDYHTPTSSLSASYSSSRAHPLGSEADAYNDISLTVLLFFILSSPFPIP